MTTRLRTLLATAAVMGITTAPALAQNARGLSVSFDLGVQASGSGDLHSGGSGTVLGLPTVVEARSYGDIYGNGFHWAAGLGVPVGPAGELRIAARSTRDDANRLQVGTVAGLPLYALFDQYSAFGMDAGYRQYLSEGRARPFVGASVGFVRLSEQFAEFTVPDAGVTLAGVHFFESSTVPAFGIGAGAQVRVTDRMAVQAAIDFRWHGAYTDRDGLAGTGLEPINDATSRWAMPITAGVTFQF